MTGLRSRHGALNVTDLARSRRFYGEVLGLPEVAERPFSFPGAWYGADDGFQIHLIVQPQVEVPRPDGDRWGRNPHLAFETEDLAALEARLIRAGCAVQRSASGRAAIFVADPDGNLLEFSQAAAD